MVQFLFEKKKKKKKQQPKHTHMQKKKKKGGRKREIKTTVMCGGCFSQERMGKINKCKHWMHADPKIGQQGDELLDKCICYLTYTFYDVAIW